MIFSQLDDGMTTVTDDLVADALAMQCATTVETMAKPCASAEMDMLAMDSHVEVC